MITIPNVKQSQLTALVTQMQASQQAQVTATSPTAGNITAHHFLMPTINASYSLADDGVLTVESNVFETQIGDELNKRLTALRAQGV